MDSLDLLRWSLAGLVVALVVLLIIVAAKEALGKGVTRDRRRTEERLCPVCHKHASRIADGHWLCHCGEHVQERVVRWSWHPKRFNVGINAGRSTKE